jgi:hypothetical protein
VYGAGDSPKIHKPVIKIKEAAVFERSQASILWILESISFMYKECNDGRNLLMKES